METTKWLTPQLKDEIRVLYEPRVNKKLSNEEVCEIANNLADFFEHFLKVIHKEKTSDDRLWQKSN